MHGEHELSSGQETVCRFGSRRRRGVPGSRVSGWPDIEAACGLLCRVAGNPVAVEDRMARWTRLVPAFAVALVLAACGQGTSDTPLSPPAARYEGGGTSVGSNYVPPPDSTEATTGTTSTSSTGSVELSGNSTSRTGGTSIGGN